MKSEHDILESEGTPIKQKSISSIKTSICDILESGCDVMQSKHDMLDSEGDVQQSGSDVMKSEHDILESESNAETSGSSSSPRCEIYLLDSIPNAPPTNQCNQNISFYGWKQPSRPPDVSEPSIHSSPNLMPVTRDA